MVKKYVDGQVLLGTPLGQFTALPRPPSWTVVIGVGTGGPGGLGPDFFVSGGPICPRPPHF